MSITQRLSITFSLLAIAIVALVIVALSAISGFQSRFEFVQYNTIPSITDLDKSISASSNFGIALYRYKVITDETKLPAAEKDIYQILDQLTLLTDYYKKNDISSDEDGQLTNLAYQNIDAVRQALPAFFAASRAHNDALTLSLMQSDTGVGSAGRKLTSDLKKQIELNITIGNGLREDNQRIYSRLIWVLSIGAALTILILGFFAIRTILSIKRSLFGMESVMSEVSINLDLTQRADDRRKDEIGKTAAAFNNLLERVGTTLSSVNDSSYSVSTASSQIAAGNEDLSSRTEQQAASLEQTSASMAALSDTVKQNAESANQANILAGTANKMSVQNGDSVKTMLTTMDDIKNSSGRISEITGLIEGIAFQTNILALNAAVEAARAGEHGRGFAVVASEVRNLAQRSSSAAREIKELITASSQQVESGASQAANVGDNSEKVRIAIQQVADIVNEIAAATTGQSQGIEQVHQAIGQMDEVTQQNAALVEEASSASRSLQEQAENLSALVSSFKVASTTERRRSPDVVKRPAPIIKGSPALSTAGEGSWESF